MDPYIMSLLSMFGAQNPGVAGPLFDKAGIPPPTGTMGDVSGGLPGAGGGPDFGSLINGSGVISSTPPGSTAPQVPGGGGGPNIGPLTGTMTPGPPPLPATPPATPPAATPPGGGNSDQVLKSLAALQGIQKPNPITPIPAVGVPGGVKAPQQEALSAHMSPQILQALSALMMRNQNPFTTSPLGALIRGKA
jgi:hypothetical protein